MVPHPSPDSSEVEEIPLSQPLKDHQVDSQWRLEESNLTDHDTEDTSSSLAESPKSPTSLHKPSESPSSGWKRTEARSALPAKFGPPEYKNRYGRDGGTSPAVSHLSEETIALGDPWSPSPVNPNPVANGDQDEIEHETSPSLSSITDMDFGGKGEFEQGESSSAEDDPEVFAAYVSWLQWFPMDFYMYIFYMLQYSNIQ